MSARTAVQAADHKLLGDVYRNHCDRCATCKTAETWCDTGAAILTAIATTSSGSDLPGYSEGA